MTHALSFYRPLAPLFLLTHAQLTVVTQSCALLYTTAHCDLLLQWRYCSCNTYCSCYSIVLLQYISQACWVLWSPRLDFFHRTVISTLVAANRLRLLRFSLFLFHHKQYYHRTASFLYLDPTPPRSYYISSTISPRLDLWYKDLSHCTFPSVIQGPLSLYDYIGILYDTIDPHTPTSSTIQIGLAYVGLDRSSI